jgi:magnesium chelatase family protein
VLASVRTFALIGVEARDVRVEVDVRGGLPAFSIVGLPDTAVRESRERVRAALGNSGFEFPQRRVTVNLAPANLPKAGPGFDLAIAAGVLVATEQLPAAALEGAGLAGELALDGRVRAVVGALPMALRAQRSGVRRLGVPRDNAPEASLAAAAPANGSGPAPAVAPIDRLAGLCELGATEALATPPRLGSGPGGGPDLCELRGQPGLRRAMEVAAAGGHSLLMLGPPGVGKSMAARRMSSILPPLDPAEAIEALAVASACGQMPPLSSALQRPFRAPHHTISSAGLVGGGSPPRPGELSRAHRGLLFLDELPEFSRDCLEALRQPLEEGVVAISRARHSVNLPCRTMLVAAANPCPCGRARGEEECECSPGAVRRYRARISGPLADRVDITITVGSPAGADLRGGPGERSADVRRRVVAARELQAARLGPGRCNAEASMEEVRRDAHLSRGGRAALATGEAALGLSGRGYDRVLRLSRTLADLAGREEVEEEDVAEALVLRSRADE